MLKTETLAVQTVPKCALSYEGDLHNPEVLAAALLAPLNDDEDILTTEQVAKVVAGVSPIGVARNALEQAGWNATIAGNRITVNDEVVAEFIGATAGPSGDVDGRWVIYPIAGTPPVWIVGAEVRP
jgi:hypothetical protein